MMDKERKHISHTFKIIGMQCVSCADIIKDELSDLSYVSLVDVDYFNERVTITGDFDGIPPEALAEDFSYLLAEFGYKITLP